MFRAITFVIAILVASPSFALFEAQGKVNNIKASGGKIMFNVCASNQCHYFYITPDSEYSKSVISILLSAKISERLIWVGGSDTPNEAWPYNGARSFSALDFKG